MTSSYTTFLPIGFSDLTEEEILIISIFRSWYEKKRPFDNIEAELLNSLRDNRIHSALSDLFLFFRSFVQLRLVHTHEQEVLSPTEEHLLAVLGRSHELSDIEPVVQRCHMSLSALNMAPRSINNINRKGCDLLQTKIAQSYRRFLNHTL